MPQASGVEFALSAGLLPQASYPNLLNDPFHDLASLARLIQARDNAQISYILLLDVHNFVFNDMKPGKSKAKLTVMVSSTVYGIEELLERVYTLLTAYGYEVWMSHKGTMPVASGKTAFENCLAAVEKCDLFLGIITQKYGSGQDPNDPNSLSITHMEIRKAIALKKQRWLLVHDHVVFARSLLRSLGYADKAGRKKLNLKKSATFEDLRILDLYEESILESLPLNEREGNWVQKFSSTDDGSLFVSAQFFRYQEVEQFIKENINGSRPNPDGGGAS